MTYDLRRLRLHGLIARIPHTHRYELTHFGKRVALFYTKLNARILRPGFCGRRQSGARKRVSEPTRTARLCAGSPSLNSAA